MPTAMQSPLQDVLTALSNCHDEQTLKEYFVPKFGDYFQASRRDILLFDAPNEELRKQRSLNQGPFKEVLNASLSLEKNPVIRYLLERHAPVHEALVASPRVWKTICPRTDHWHVIAGPIVGRSQLVGIIGCTRQRSMPAFDEQNLVDLSAVCLHLSSWVSTVQSQRSDLNGKCLTPRERQIAELVALGKTNSEIGHELWISESSVKQALKRMFRKLAVSSRTQMVTKLLQTDVIGHV